MVERQKLKKLFVSFFLIFGTMSVFALVGCSDAENVSNMPDNLDKSADTGKIMAQIEQPDCEILRQKLDTTTIDVSDCDALNSDRSLTKMVGGNLLNITKQYVESYERYEYTLTFQGKETQQSVYITAKTESEFESRGLEIGRFYEFDMLGKCALIFSMASSGAFTGPFKEKECGS